MSLNFGHGDAASCYLLTVTLNDPFKVESAKVDKVETIGDFNLVGRKRNSLEMDALVNLLNLPYVWM